MWAAHDGGMSESFQALSSLVADHQLDEARPALARVLSFMEVRTLQRRGQLFAEGERASALYVIRSGTIKLARTTANGRSSVLALLGPGELVGELSLLDGRPRGATATALTEVSVLELSEQAFDRWLVDEPEAAGLLLRQLAQRMRRSNDVVSDLVFSDVPARVARTLLDLAGRFATTDGEGRPVVRHELTQEELAQLVGAARETVNKTLADFAARGWIALQQRSFTLLAADQLARRVG